MNRPMIRNTLLATMLTGSALLSQSAFAVPLYAITDLGTLRGTSSIGYSIKHSDQVTQATPR